MKTEIYKCSECGVVEFHWRENEEIDGRTCGIVRREKLGAEYASLGAPRVVWLAPEPCNGVMEYYGYHDFDRFK